MASAAAELHRGAHRTGERTAAVKRAKAATCPNQTGIQWALGAQHPTTFENTTTDLRTCINLIGKSVQVAVL